VVGVELPRPSGGLSLQLANFFFLAVHLDHRALLKVLDVIDGVSEVKEPSAKNIVFCTGPLDLTCGALRLARARHRGRKSTWL